MDENDQISFEIVGGEDLGAFQNACGGNFGQRAGGLGEREGHEKRSEERHEAFHVYWCWEPVPFGKIGECGLGLFATD